MNNSHFQSLLQIDFLTKGDINSADVDHAIKTALPKLADFVQEGISNGESLDKTVDILHKMTSLADASNVSIESAVCSLSKSCCCVSLK